MREIPVRPIGTVQNPIRILKREGWDSVISEIVLKPGYEEALDGIEDYSHLFVLFWITRIPRSRRGMLKVHPKSREDLPFVGIFATRTQYRPNPIGLTLVELLSRKKNVLRIRGLDAVRGTPVLDLKPISPAKEFPARVRVPEWYHLLWDREGRRGGNSRRKRNNRFSSARGAYQRKGGEENMSPETKKTSRPLTGLEVLGKAIRSEVEAYRFYIATMKRASNPILLEKLSKLAGEEKRHRQILEERYRKNTGETRVPLPPPAGPEGKGPVPKDLRPEEILTVAIRMEREAAQFYQREARKAKDMSGRFMLEYLADFERGHEKALETELKALKRFPNWFSLDDPVVMLVG